MSYTIYLEKTDEPCPQCGRGGGASDEIEIGNITWNVSKMVEHVWGAIGCDMRPAEGSGYDHTEDAYSWKRLAGHTMDEVIPFIRQAYDWWRENEWVLEPMNPPNGWGSTKCLERIYASFINAYNEGYRGKVRLS